MLDSNELSINNIFNLQHQAFRSRCNFIKMETLPRIKLDLAFKQLKFLVDVLMEETN